MLLLRFYLISGTAFLSFSVTAIILSRLGLASLPESLLVVFGIFGLMLLAPVYLTFDEEESVVAGKIAAFLLIAFSICSLLLDPTLPTAVFAIVSAAFGMIGYAFAASEESELKKEVLMVEWTDAD